MLSVPFALIGGVWLMYWLGFNLSVAAAVGFIALAGVAAETCVVGCLAGSLHPTRTERRSPGTASPITRDAAWAVRRNLRGSIPATAASTLRNERGPLSARRFRKRWATRRPRTRRFWGPQQRRLEEYVERDGRALILVSSSAPSPAPATRRSTRRKFRAGNPPAASARSPWRRLPPPAASPRRGGGCAAR